MQLRQRFLLKSMIALSLVLSACNSPNGSEVDLDFDRGGWNRNTTNNAAVARIELDLAQVGNLTAGDTLKQALIITDAKGQQVAPERVNIQWDVTRGVEDCTATVTAKDKESQVSGSANLNFCRSGAGQLRTPVINLLSSTSGSIGDTVLIAGIGFTGATRVTFGDTEAEFNVTNDGLIRATVPSGSGPITVTTPQGNASSSESFVTQVLDALTINAAAIGDSLTITGSDMAGISSIRFNGVEAAFTLDSSSQVTVQVPATASTGALVVVQNGLSQTLSESFEITNRIWFVDAKASGTGDGGTWANAFTDLQSALASASSDDQVWVAAGSYTPSATGDTSVSFILVPDVDVYGGFDGSEAYLSARNSTQNLTLLSGDLEGNDNYSDNSDADLVDNSRRVVSGASDLILDGFTIQGAYGDGGLFADDVSDLRLNHLIFRQNTNQSEGGGAYFNRSTVVLQNVVFDSNTSVLSGGGLAIDDGTLSLQNAVFYNNTSTDFSAGGLFLRNTVGDAISQLTFYKNSAHSSVAFKAELDSSGRSVVSHNLLVAEFANRGDILENEETLSLSGGFLIWNNSEAIAAFDDPVLFNRVYSNFYGANEDPFVDSSNPAGADGIWMTADDGLRLRSGAGGIDLGTTGDTVLDTDILGQSRDSSPDVGAYAS